MSNILRILSATVIKISLLCENEKKKNTSVFWNMVYRYFVSLECAWVELFPCHWVSLSCLQCFDAVGWAAGRASGHVKNWMVGCWHGCLSGARCRLAYGPADASATLSLAPVKSRLVSPFWYRLTRVVLDRRPLNGCVCVCVFFGASVNSIICYAYHLLLALSA